MIPPQLIAMLGSKALGAVSSANKGGRPGMTGPSGVPAAASGSGGLFGGADVKGILGGLGDLFGGGGQGEQPQAQIQAPPVSLGGSPTSRSQSLGQFMGGVGDSPVFFGGGGNDEVSSLRFRSVFGRDPSGPDELKILS
jgi:hypothetical protein